MYKKEIYHTKTNQTTKSGLQILISSKLKFEAPLLNQRPQEH